jgi:Raf kinase inhibitor-like YbhB/YbcL family protein
MRLTSSSFEDGQEIPQLHGKKGRNVPPGLAWQNPPPGTRSYALSVVDTDPVAQGYVHWLVVDIDPATSTLAEGDAVPQGALEVSPYSGPLPPSGSHDYEFTLYALDTPDLDLPRDPSLGEFEAAAEPHTLATATLMGTFTKAS